MNPSPPVLLLLYLAHLAWGQLAPPVDSPCPHALKMNTNSQFRAALHFVCLQRTSRLPQLELVQYQPRRLLVSAPVLELGTEHLASFVDQDGLLRVLTAVPNRINGTSMYSVEPEGPTLLAETHTINTQFVSAMSVWKLELNADWQLAIANQPYLEQLATGGQARPGPLPEARPMITVHSWRATYFDSYQLIELPAELRVNKLEPMNINGQELLVAALEPHRYQLGERPAQQAHSLVYKLDFGDGELTWRLFQRLDTEAALDARAFSVSHLNSLQRDHYLALLGSSRAPACRGERGLLIYKYLGDRFVCYRALGAPEATKLEAISYGQGDSYALLALLAAATNQLQLYLFDGLTLRPVAGPPGWRPFGASPPPPQGRQLRRSLDPPAFHLFLAPEPSEAASKRTLEPALPALALAGPPALPAAPLYRVPLAEAVRAAEAGPQKRAQAGQEQLSWCRRQIELVLRDRFVETSKRLRALPRVDQRRPIELWGDLLLEGDLSVSNLLYANRVAELNGSRLASLAANQAQPADLTPTFQQIERVHLEIDGLRRRVERLLVDDGSPQDVFTPLHFGTLRLECLGPRADPRLPAGLACPQVGELRARYLNGRDVGAIGQQALLTGRSWRIAQDVRFEHLVLRGAVELRGPLNGRPLADIVFKRGPPGAPIQGHKQFRGGLAAAGRLRVHFWNAQPVDRSTHLTSSGFQRVEVDLRPQRVLLEGAGARFHALNGLHLDEYLSQIALADADNKFELPLELDELRLRGPTRLTQAARLNGLDLEELWLQTMFKQSSQNVTAPITFAGQVLVSFGGDIQVDGLFNGLVLRPELVLMANREQLVANPLVFTGDVTARELYLERALNGIQVLLNPASGQRELSILLDGGQQQLSGEKLLTELTLAGQSQIHGHVNGHLNLSQLHLLASSRELSHKFASVRLTGSRLRVGPNLPLHIGQSVDGVPVGELCALARRAARTASLQLERLRFQGPVRFRELRCAQVGGFASLARSFLTRHGDQRVQGALRLAGGLLVNTSLQVHGRLAGLETLRMREALGRQLAQNLTGRREHAGDLHLDELLAERLDGLALRDVLLARADAPQLVRAPLTFEHLDIENVLVVGAHLSARAFNGLDLADLLSNTLQYDKPQQVQVPLSVDSLHVAPSSQLNVRLINGLHLRRVYADAVLRDAHQVILGAKQFAGPLEFARLHSQFGLAGLTSDQLRLHLLVQADEPLEGDLELTEDAWVRKELLVSSGLVQELDLRSGLISEVDVSLFVKSMVERTGQTAPKVLGNGSVWFKDVKAGQLVVGGTVGGVDVSREAVTRVPPLLAAPQPPRPPQVTPRPLPALTSSPAALTWAPKWRPVGVQTLIARPQPPALNLSLVESAYLDQLARWRSAALGELGGRVNPLLSASFYYEIAMKHPGLGPALHIGPAHSDSALMYLKATNRPGEPCLVRGQTVAIMGQQRQLQAPMFTQSSLLQETSNPTIVDSLLLPDNQLYLFVLDTFPEGARDLLSQVLVYLWDQRLGMYELRERVSLDGHASALRAFALQGLACFALAQPRVIYANATGWPTIHCQSEPGGDFGSSRHLLPLANVFQLQLAASGPGRLLVAALSHARTTDTQLGELSLLAYDLRAQQVLWASSRPLVNPLALHLMRPAASRPLELQLVVSEALTSDNLLAPTRVFSLQQQASSNQFAFHESQLISSAGQVEDIKSVRLDGERSLLFLQSAGAISVYASARPQEAQCAPEYALVQRLPTRGAHRFLVFPTQPSGHILVLSKDDCEQLDYATLVLRAQINTLN